MLVPFTYADECLVQFTIRQHNDGTINFDYTRASIVSNSYKSFTKSFYYYAGFYVMNYEDKREVYLFVRNNSTAKIRSYSNISLLGTTNDQDTVGITYFTFELAKTNLTDYDMNKVQKIYYPDLYTNKIFQPVDIDSVWPGNTIVYQNLLAAGRTTYHFTAFWATGTDTEFQENYVDSYIYVRYHSTEGVKLKVINLNPDSPVTLSYDEVYVDNAIGINRVRNLTITLPLSKFWICNLESRYGDMSSQNYALQEFVEETTTEE